MAPFFSLHAPSPSPRPSLTGEVSCDVLVIGGGICGILTAHLLSLEGLDVILLEANRLLSGQTLGTTAKITAQHGLFAERLIRAVGLERARGYAQANLQAVDALAHLAETCAAECGLSRQSAYLYTLGNPRPLEAEARACEQLGLSVRSTRHLPAPLLPALALRMDHQAQINPLPLLHQLAKPLRVFEHSRVLSLSGSLARTAHGCVRSSAIVVCTHYPAFTLPGAYFMRLYQQRSYTLALSTRQRVDGMLYGVGPGAVSIRRAEGAVFLGGESHRCGQSSPGCYERLRQEARRLFPQAREQASWSAQDCITMDGIPYVGRYSRRMPDVYVATGFGKWGMTNAMAAATLLKEEITGRGSPFADVFSPLRLPGMTAAGGMAVQAGHACVGLASSALPPPLRTAESLSPGEGAIIHDGLRKVAAYRDPGGRLHSISPYCAHMRCLLRFNADECSWDCPCHGSRFTVDGELIGGPAQKQAPQRLPDRHAPSRPHSLPFQSGAHGRGI